MNLAKIFGNGYFMGMNYRNSVLVNKLNPIKSIELVDDKLKYKELLEKHNIPTPKLLGTIDSMLEIGLLKEIKCPFVIKPRRGYAGKGILIIIARTGDKFIDATGKTWDFYDLKKHAFRIFEGMFSLGNRFDQIVIEEKIIVPSFIKKIFPYGVPDIRIIYYKNMPILSMARIPNEKSGGKANLSQGADAISIDISTGKILGYYSKESKNTAFDLKSFGKVPDWKKVIRIGQKASVISGLGYSGVDIVFDIKGFMVLECNARPGLEIQNVTKKNLVFAIKDSKGYESEPYAESERSAFFIPISQDNREYAMN